MNIPLPTYHHKPAQHSELPWTFGVYEPTSNFRAVSVHECVCKPDGALIATCGPAGHSLSEQDAEIICRAVNSHEAFVIAARTAIATLAPLENSVIEMAQIIELMRTALQLAGESETPDIILGHDEAALAAAISATAVQA